MATVHGDFQRQQGGHGVIPAREIRERLAQVHQPSAFGVDGASLAGEVPDLPPHLLVGRQLGGEALGISAAEIEPGDPVRKRRIGDGAERHKLGAGRFEEAQVFEVIEAEGAVPGEADAHARGRPGPTWADRWSGPALDAEDLDQAVHVEGLPGPGEDLVAQSAGPGVSSRVTSPRWRSATLRASSAGR